MNFDFAQYFNTETLDKIIRIAFLILLSVFVIQGVAFLIKRSITHRLSKQSRMIINRIIVYTGYTLLSFMVLKELNFDITALFGAAGVVGIIIGVASQTSIGNIISGFFLVSEKSFELGDVVRIGDKAGTVYSVDLLSIKIRTYDNLLLRIPNQTVISSELINVTRFPIRRLDVTVGVAYKEDLRKVFEVLKEVARKNPLCLEEPEPLILLQGYGASSIDILFAVWFEKNNYRDAKNSVIIEIKEAFDREGIEIPFPHISVYTGEATKPFPVEMMQKKTT
ncbi:mechanosensitive ion channel family protein [Mangrovibacterium marinum]|uniref:Mechanosensitive ion channel-like protein n=1 Tax=Mangrovibacterium marinum TaxID=1639118 RepID=A0A2T5C519_9BACT|nr:mechanosensitive ion channel family protein [Mangrovibacterium marinum]PTN09964.1 mechanosensitive ion channel-like protein [Mangrovibacterium marinum]